jgi:hypothetical protein
VVCAEDKRGAKAAAVTKAAAVSAGAILARFDMMEVLFF